MRLTTLGFRGFRNLTETRIEPSARFNVISGPNAQGKTNVLEAIYVLGSLKSFRASHHRDLIQFGSDQAVVRADIERDGLERTVRVELDRRRRVYINDNPTRRLDDYLGTVPVVLFAPEDVTLLRGSPSARRTFLDRAVFTTRAAYLQDLNRHGEILKRRNAVLKDERPDIGLLGVYTEQIIEVGARVACARLDYLHHFKPFFERAFEHIFGVEPRVDIGVETSWGGSRRVDELADNDEIADAMGVAFERAHRDEIRRGLTLVGPQRDDLVVELAGRPAKVHASQGQHRSLVLALKTSEISMLRDRFEIQPILLLDDVSSELDRKRNSQLFEFLADFHGQVFITTTSREYIQLSDEDVTSYAVADGQLSLVS